MEDLLAIIKKRQSTRGAYDTSKSISKEDLEKILEAGSWAPTAHNMQNFEVIAIDDRKTLEAIRNIKLSLPEGTMEENNLHSSATVEELLKKKTGILSRMPPQLEKPGGNPQDYLQEVVRKSYMATATLVILMYDSRQRAPGSDDDFLGKISLGCVLENMWLMANYLGIALHIVSAVSREDYAKPVRELLGIPEYFNLALSFRLGYPVSTTGNYIRVRRDMEDFTYYNRFGNKNADI